MTTINLTGATFGDFLKVAANHTDIEATPVSVVESTDFTSIVQITQAAYDDLDPPDPTTLYIVVG